MAKIRPGAYRYLWLCDGEPTECSKSHCYKSGGPCRYTTNREHALHPDAPDSAFLPCGDGISQIEMEATE